MVEPSVAEIRKIVCDTFLLDPASVEPDTPLEELGIDSKGRIRLLATLEVFYEVTIDLDERDRLTDIAAVARVLAEARDNKPGETAAS
ncbi:acyl carrier protein [Amycolatopsis alkalitolerans]|uniref:Acyl carrier protein n=1 Tax=Amycolatopsis alkalitolerans TaxID=2547244 RepID=A0A5C4M9X0_9PSEU|nr:acyl carrier protein [Amycolatopsis alkalitolerans]TNC28729.1 acyl carrier protein [Amycolatopsis alkalitolerans]